MNDGRWRWAAIGIVSGWPLVCHAQPSPPVLPNPSPPSQEQPVIVAPPPAGAALPPVEPIVSDSEFKAAIPPVSPDDDPELTRPLEPIAAFERQTGTAPAADAELGRPLPPLETFDVAPARFTETEQPTGAVDLVYQVQLAGLDAGAWFHPRFAGTRIPTLEQAIAAWQADGQQADTADVLA